MEEERRRRLKEQEERERAKDQHSTSSQNSVDLEQQRQQELMRQREQVFSSNFRSAEFFPFFISNFKWNKRRCAKGDANLKENEQ